MKFGFKNLGNSGEDKNARRYTTFGFKIEKSSIIVEYIEKNVH